MPEHVQHATHACTNAGKQEPQQLVGSARLGLCQAVTLTATAARAPSQSCLERHIERRRQAGPRYTGMQARARTLDTWSRQALSHITPVTV
jgi:hypothetical protein